jgi:hypothetical protein
MDLAHLGPYHYPGTSLGAGELVRTSLSWWRTITRASKPDAISNSARFRPLIFSNACWASCRRWQCVCCSCAMLPAESQSVLRAQVLDADVLAIVAAQTNQSPTEMTTHAFWNAVAQMGGYLSRHGDGSPGWKTPWKGWLRVQTLLEGVHLAFHLRL